MAETATIKYRAFLSYAHADTAWAKWLHAALEGFRIDNDLAGRDTPLGPVPKTLRPIFRDREDFSGGHTLTDATIAALDASSALIVLCSTISAGRPAVNEEVRLFRSRHPDRPVIPIIVEGTWPDNFPPALRHELAPDGTVTDRPITILGPDLRESGDGKNLGLAKAVAGMIGVGSDDIFRRAERERRRAARFRNVVIATVGILFVAILVALYSWNREQRWRSALLEAFQEDRRKERLLTPMTEERERALRPGESFVDCLNQCPEMIVVPAGQFMMGSPAHKAGEKSEEVPQHKVTIAKAFAVSKFEITADQWDACVAAYGCARTVGRILGHGRQPVINVSWEDAKAYVEWLSNVIGRSYRLLSEAEWEYAARGGSTLAFPWGDAAGINNANCNGCGSQWDNQSPAPVGSFAPNGFGLHDMIGNVWEWCEDSWHDSYLGAPVDGSAWVESNPAQRVLRGGSWRDTPAENNVTARRSFFSAFHQREFNLGFGFRVARTLSSSP